MAIRAFPSRLSLVVALSTGLLCSVGGCARVPGLYTYEGAGATATGPGATKAFDATAYVADIWSTKVLPTVGSDAVPAATLLPALESDQAAASAKYGHQAGTGSPYAFLIRGTGKVTAVDDGSPSRPMTVAVDGLPAGTRTTLALVTGPVIAGTAVRDALGFIGFGDFTNQLDYADAATALNSRVKADVLSSIDTTALVGRTVSFAGAFSLVAPGSVLVVPVELTVTP